MMVYRGLEQAPSFSEGCVLTIGNFDGVHLGHRRLIATARAAAAGAGDGGLPVAVLTFDPHPAEVLAPDRAPARLTLLNERIELLSAAGADACIVADARGGVLRLSPREFLHGPVARLRPRVIVEGPTFRFGRGRTGDVAMLAAEGAALGARVVIVEELHCDALAGRPAINSSSIRAALGSGEVATARAMLGRPYRIVGVVVDGAGRGAGLGFPTANLAEIPHLTPGFGVYACVAECEDGSRRAAAVNVGPQPTFDQSVARVEAHLLDFSGNLRGARLALHFLERLRGQRKFADAAALREQLAGDAARVREVVGAWPDKNLCKV